MTRVRITSDGTSRGTKVVDVETGAEISVSAIDWHWDADHPNAIVKLTLPFTEGEVEGEIE